jgi:hypothetical protein
LRPPLLDQTHSGPLGRAADHANGYGIGFSGHGLQRFGPAGQQAARFEQPQ